MPRIVRSRILALQLWEFIPEFMISLIIQWHLQVESSYEFAGIKLGGATVQIPINVM